MDYSNVILIFSNKSIDSIKPEYLPDNRPTDKLKLISDPHRLRDIITDSICAQILIDSDSPLSSTDLEPIVYLAGQKNIPIIIGQLHEDSSEKPTAIEFSAGNRVTLSRKWPESIPIESHNLRLVTETAATLCHEINNPLLTITANIEMLLSKSNKLPEEVKKKVELIGHAADRIKEATEKLIDIDSLNYKDTIAGRIIQLAKATDKIK